MLPYLRDKLHRCDHRVFFKRLWDEFSARGARLRLADNPLCFTGTPPEDGNLHFIQNGLIQGEGVLNVTIAMIEPYWQVDPKGILADSSIRDAVFNPRKIGWKPSKALMRELKRDKLVARRSRYVHGGDRVQLPEDAVVLFYQGDGVLTQRAQTCSTEDMLRAMVEGAGGRPVVVKPHPLIGLRGMEDTLEKLRGEGMPIDVIDGNVHDMLDQVAVTVSVNSACSFEGFLHRKPAILFGKSDFHHFAINLEDPFDFSAGLERALSFDGPYVKYIWWYLEQQNISGYAPDFFDRVMARAALVGFDADRLGLGAPQWQVTG